MDMIWCAIFYIFLRRTVVSQGSTRYPTPLPTQHPLTPTPSCNPTIAPTSPVTLTHQVTKFSYKGYSEVVQLPNESWVSQIFVYLWGASGGGGYPGAGAYVEGTLNVSPGQILEVMVGQSGNPTYRTTTFGGGGAGYGVGGDGGGRSAIRYLGQDIVTAGGGGGGGYDFGGYYYKYGGSSTSLLNGVIQEKAYSGVGDFNDYDASNSVTTAPGTGGNYSHGGSYGGAQYLGGTHFKTMHDCNGGSGGGGGYYGGGASNCEPGAGGGSSYMLNLVPGSYDGSDSGEYPATSCAGSYSIHFNADSCGYNNHGYVVIHLMNMPTTISPSIEPTSTLSSLPTPILTPTSTPTSLPTLIPASIPTKIPTSMPNQQPTSTPTSIPTLIPRPISIAIPISMPTLVPTPISTRSPSPNLLTPTLRPTHTSHPTLKPTTKPQSCRPTIAPSVKTVFSSSNNNEKPKNHMTTEAAMAIGVAIGIWVSVVVLAICAIWHKCIVPRLRRHSTRRILPEG